MHLRHHTEEGLNVRWLSVRGLSVRTAIREGNRARPPLLILNGIGASFEMLLPFIDAIPDTEVIIFDAPGAGKSAAPAWPWRLRDYADAAADIVGQLGYKSVNVMGVSWGGALAQEFAKRHADKCAHLVLAATSPGHIMVPGRPTVLMHMTSPRRYWDRNYMKRIAGTIYGGTFRTNRLRANEFANSTNPPSQRGYYYQLLAILGWSSLPWLHRLKMPTLILQGEDDPLIPVANGRILAAMIPNSRLVQVNCGHLFMITRANEVGRLVKDFMNEKSATVARAG